MAPALGLTEAISAFVAQEQEFPDRNYSRDPLVLSRELVRPSTLTGDPQVIQAHVNFDVVLDRL